MSRIMPSTAAAVAAVARAGCQGDDPNKPRPEPVPTDGPNQVVVYVPSMT